MLKTQTTLHRNFSRNRRNLLQQSIGVLGALQVARFSAIASAAQSSGIADAYRDLFRIGIAVSNRTLDENIAADLQLIAREFNTVTGENAMKWGEIRPDGVNWEWERPDKLVDFATSNNIYAHGHTLVWHSQVPRSVFTDAAGNPLSREALLARLEEHISIMVGRYKGRINAWDVVNEAIDEGKGWRTSQWFNIIGDDFMEQAFRMAHAADPDATLFYNDYNMHNPQKRAFLVEVLKDYQARGVPIHGVGLQGHLGLAYPDLEEWERSIATYADMGFEMHISELDVDVLPSPDPSADIATRAQYSPDKDPWPNGLPDDMQEKLADRYEQIFRILLKYRTHVKRVTMWGLHDGVSWKNNFPVRGRTNYPLLFDRAMQPKPAYYRLIDLARSV